jgi:AcrR family transcriptional regulator
MAKSAEVTRERILESAYRLFRRDGYARVSMDEIAAAAHVTKRTLYHHFRSKDDLLARVLQVQHGLALQAFQTFASRMTGTPDAIVKGMFRGSPYGQTSPSGAARGSRVLSSSWPTCQGIPHAPLRGVTRRSSSACSPTCWDAPGWCVRKFWRVRSGCFRRVRSR